MVNRAIFYAGAALDAVSGVILKTAQDAVEGMLAPPAPILARAQVRRR